MENELQGARRTRADLLNVYGQEAWQKYPHLMEMVDGIYVVRGAELVILGLIAATVCAWATGIIR